MAIDRFWIALSVSILTTAFAVMYAAVELALDP
jgi:hypothetical protein